MSKFRNYIIAVLALGAIWLLLPNFEKQNLLSARSIPVQIPSKTTVDSEEDESIDKYRQTGYFSIFKFITGFLPGRK